MQYKSSDWGILSVVLQNCACIQKHLEGGPRSVYFDRNSCILATTAHGKDRSRNTTAEKTTGDVNNNVGTGRGDCDVLALVGRFVNGATMIQIGQPASLGVGSLQSPLVNS